MHDCIYIKSKQVTVKSTQWLGINLDYMLRCIQAVSSIMNNESKFPFFLDYYNWRHPRYHWGFLVGPKSESKTITPGTRYHVRNLPIGGWKYEEVLLDNVQCSTNLLARIVIAKIEDEQRLLDIFRTTRWVQHNPNWRCRTWVGEVLTRIQQDGTIVGTSILDWPTIEATAREYVAKKAASDRYSRNFDMELPKPTYNLYEKMEVIS